MPQVREFALDSFSGTDYPLQLVGSSTRFRKRIGLPRLGHWPLRPFRTDGGADGLSIKLTTGVPDRRHVAHPMPPRLRQVPTFLASRLKGAAIILILARFGRRRSRRGPGLKATGRRRYYLQTLLFGLRGCRLRPALEAR